MLRIFLLVALLILNFVSAPSVAVVDSAVVKTTESTTADTTPNTSAQSTVTEKQPRTEKPKEERSVLDSVTETLGDAIGLLRKGRMEGDEGIPRKIAVLPAAGQGDERERDDIRTAIHNNLSSKNFELLKPYDIDRILAQIEQTENLKYTDFDPQELAKKLDVEGLIYVDVPLVEQIYAAAYAHYKITVRLRFYSAAEDNFIWEKEESTAEREGGITLNPISFIAQAISSAQVLTEAVRQSLVDKLARIFAGEIPFPLGERRKIKPINIEMTVSNVAEGPFRSGDQVSVFMRAEPGLAASFDIGSKFVGLPMTEQGEGEYVGRYVVSDNDNADDQIISIAATRVKDKATIQWRVPGRVGIDTIVPETIQNLESSPVKDGIQLSWPSQSSDHETLIYHIERADPQSGRYQEIAAINIQQYIDREITEGNTYHYRIYASDEAKNLSGYANIQVAAVGAGPTTVAEDLLTDTTYYAVASPYIIKKPIRVLRGATLTLSPGTIVQFAEAGKLEVLGQVKALGDQQSPIVIGGDRWQIDFANTGENLSHFTQTKFNHGAIKIDQSSVIFEQVEFREMEQAIKLSNNGKMTVKQSEFAQNNIGIVAEGGELTLDQVNFVGNKLAWQNSGRVEFTSNQLTFDENLVHIQTDRPILIKNAIFSDQDYEDLIGKLDGDIKLDFSGLADKYNLLDQWLKARWIKILDAAQQELWQETYEGLQTLQQQSSGDQRMERFSQILKSTLGKPLSQSNEFIVAMQRFEKRDGKGKLWIHELRLPFTTGIADSDGYLIKQASGKFTADFLKSQYPDMRPAELRKYRRQINLKDDIVASEVIHTDKRGLFLHVWLADYLDMKKINHSLLMAGLVKKENSALMVGLLSQTDVFELEELIVQALKKQGINYIALGTGAYGKPAQAKAKKMGANIVLETAVMTDESVSGLSKNLKMVNINLILDIYDVHSNKSLEHLTASADKAGFKQRQIIKKAVTEAYGGLESKMISALWSADDLVTEHKKAERERIRLEQIAAAKAKKEREKAQRLAKIKAEKERLAQEKAAQEKLAQQKAAQEKAAAELAEQQRLAQAQAAAAQKAAMDNAAETGVVKEQNEPKTPPLSADAPNSQFTENQQNVSTTDVEP